MTNPKNPFAFKYANVGLELIRFIPELKVPYQRLVDEWVIDKPGQYIVFENLFQHFVEILLSIRKNSPAKERLLKRSFEFIEGMVLYGDSGVRDLAGIAMFEGKPDWYFALSRKYWGPQTFFAVSQWEGRLEEFLKAKTRAELDHEFIDIYGVRESILKALKKDGASREDIPGISYPSIAVSLKSIGEAKKYPDGVVFLSCYGTSVPYVVAPAHQVSCGAKALKRLVCDLVQYDRREPKQERKTSVEYFRIPLNERIWNMGRTNGEHGKYRGKLWIKDKFLKIGLGNKIKDILSDRTNNRAKPKV